MWRRCAAEQQIETEVDHLGVGITLGSWCHEVAHGGGQRRRSLQRLLDLENPYGNKQGCILIKYSRLWRMQCSQLCGLPTTGNTERSGT